MPQLQTVLVKVIVAIALLISLASAQYPKRGLAYNEDISITNFGGPTSEVFWQYNWDSDTDFAQDYTEYTPMLWSDMEDHTTQWDANVNKWLGQGNLPTAHLLGFNECDNPGQSNMSPQEAATAYLQYITPYAGRATLVSPSVTNAPSGIPWMQQFMTLCVDCQIDIWAFHWYDITSNFAGLQAYTEEICSSVIPSGSKMWYTEFEPTPIMLGAPNNATAQSDFMSQALPYLDDNPCVDRYAWFGTADPDQNLLIGKGPVLSQLGSQYANEAFDIVLGVVAESDQVDLVESTNNTGLAFPR